MKITWQRVFNINEWNDAPSEFVKEISISRGDGSSYAVTFMAYHPGKMGCYSFLVTEFSDTGGIPFTRNGIEHKWGVKE